MSSSNGACPVCGGQTKREIRDNRPAGCGDTGYFLVQECEKCGQENILNSPQPPVCRANKIQGVFC